MSKQKQDHGTVAPAYYLLEGGGGKGSRGASQSILDLVRAGCVALSLVSLATFPFFSDV